jgi:hypothetical protein
MVSWRNKFKVVRLKNNVDKVDVPACKEKIWQRKRKRMRKEGNGAWNL